VTGVFGGPMAAVEALRRGAAPDPAHMDRFARPVPRLREARWLAEQGVRAMVDISDGIASDMRHIAAASGVLIQLYADKLPVLPGVDQIAALGGGEEYELIVCAPYKVDLPAFEREFGIPLTELGRVLEGPAGVRARYKGDRVDLPLGYDHFAS
jgi:thiamine-monophosphate kinase